MRAPSTNCLACIVNRCSRKSSAVPSIAQSFGGRTLVPGSFLKRRAEAKLDHTGGIRDVEILRGLAIPRIALLEDVGTVVRPVEDIEYFGHRVQLERTKHRKLATHADVHAVNRLPTEAVARHERPVGS